MWRTRWAVVAAVVLAGAFRAAPAEDPSENPPVTELATSPNGAGPAANEASTPAPEVPAPATVGAAEADPGSTTAVTAARTPATLPLPRVVHEQPWTPFATAGGLVVLHHPSSRVERVGFHESNHDGARDLSPRPTAASPVTLEGRHRGTGERTAVDVVVDPDSEIRAPVTGKVRRAGTYVLYCDNKDDYVVIEPDSRPGWEVKLLHINGVMVRAGQRVVAGETVLAPRATVLPFESQVDEVTAKPAWPHVHIEVVDPSIRDRPSGRGC